MSCTIKNQYFEARINPSTQTLELLEIFKPKDNGELDLNEFVEMREIVRYIGVDGPIINCKEDPIDKLILPRGVREIRRRAFYKAPIKGVVWPDNCPNLEQSTFKLSRVESIENIQSIKTMEEGVFASSHIHSFDVPDGLKVIPEDCFLGSELGAITNTEHLTGIGKNAFAFTSLREFHWPSQCREIKDYTFSSCVCLTSVENIQDVEFIGEKAFSNCSLLSFSWPKKCSCIKPNTFINCTFLKSVSGFEHVFEIGDCSFLSSGITKIDLSQSICSSIGNFAFANSALKEFTPGYYLKAVDDTAFKNTYFEKSGGVKNVEPE